MKRIFLRTTLLAAAILLAAPITHGESESINIYGFGNSDFSFGNNSGRHYEYRYSDEKESDYKTYETGLRSNYIYAPAYSGRENCYRHDRNYIYCGR